VGTAVAQNELRMIMTNLAGVVAGGQVFITFKEDLIDSNHEINNEGTRSFLKGFLDGFARIAGKLAA
jgi:chromate reductase